MWTSRKEMIFSCMESLNTLMISRFISVWVEIHFTLY
jgi:hypothetical protein